MPAADLFTTRKSLDQICTVPERIISVYSLEKHVWANANRADARKARTPELRTIEEFQIDPVRPFLNDILRNMAAPYKRESRENPIGQGYWIQAEFGSGKSHLLCFLSALALGDKKAWAMIDEKEKKAERGKRESLHRFWEEGIADKSQKSKGVLVVVKTLVGSGGGTIGLQDKGYQLSKYIIDAVKDQLQVELGKNVSLYPVELLADHFLQHDLDRSRKDLEKFLRDPKYFEPEEQESLDDFLSKLQQDKVPEYKRSCGDKLWRFYKDYLRMTPDVAAETEDVLKHVVETVVGLGYSGMLLVLDEVSNFMKNRDDMQRNDDINTLVVLSNRLAKVHNLPLWTVCAAQEAIQRSMGVQNIIAEDRLKQVNLLTQDKDYYSIVLARVRDIKDSAAVIPYFQYYRRGFSWPNSIGEDEFRHFFPFHRPAIEVLREITYKMTTTRSAITVMHHVLKHQVKHEGKELIRLWELFDETIRYEEDSSSIVVGLAAIKSNKDVDYRAYEQCLREIDAATGGFLKVHREKAVRILQTLFLYHVAQLKQQGLTPDEIANSVLIEADAENTVQDNVDHYETLAEHLSKQLRQIVRTTGDDKKARYKFDPVVKGINPQHEFEKARATAEANEPIRNEAWEQLLSFVEWQAKAKQRLFYFSAGVKSPFADLWAGHPAVRPVEKDLEIFWQNRETKGVLRMIDGQMSALPLLRTEESERDFAVYISTKPLEQTAVEKLLNSVHDPRILVWTPDPLHTDERDRLIRFAAYRKLVSEWQGKDSEDAVAVLDWVSKALETEMGLIMSIVRDSYLRGCIAAQNHSQFEFHGGGELVSILTPLVEKVLNETYESRDIKFETRFQKADVIKVINGIVKSGSIPKGTKANQNISAVQNFGFGLKILRKGVERELDTSDNPYVKAMWEFIDEKLLDDTSTMPVATLYKNFMGVGGPKDYGLSRRLVQLYLLCLAREGKIRIAVNAKAGIGEPAIYYANMQSIEFKADVLDAMLQVSKVARPENWDTLRPYAEKLLGEIIQATNDDSVISEYRAKLVALFKAEKDLAPRVKERAVSLFRELKLDDPYEDDIEKMVSLFQTELDDTNDIQRILYGMKTALDYEAFDSGVVKQNEIDDLANRILNYRNIAKFVDFRTELTIANQYCTVEIPDGRDLRSAIEAQQALQKKMKDIRPYVDSDIRLKQELIGKTPPDGHEVGTLGKLIHEYGLAYFSVHEQVIASVDKSRERINGIRSSKEYSVLPVFEQLAIFGDPVKDFIDSVLDSREAEIHSCDASSRSAVLDALRNGPVHDCGLTFSSADEYVAEAEHAADEAIAVWNQTMNTRLGSLLSPALRQNLERGKSDPVVKSMLSCKTADELRSVLTDAFNKNASAVESINRYLKEVVLRSLKISDFKPSNRTIEKHQIPEVTAEFQRFLESALGSDDGSGSTTVITLEP